MDNPPSRGNPSSPTESPSGARKPGHVVAPALVRVSVNGADDPDPDLDLEMLQVQTG
jgi:hypothetical protein